MGVIRSAHPSLWSSSFPIKVCSFLTAVATPHPEALVGQKDGLSRSDWLRHFFCAIDMISIMAFLQRHSRRSTRLLCFVEILAEKQRLQVFQFHFLDLTLDRDGMFLDDGCSNFLGKNSNAKVVITCPSRE